MAEKKQPPMTPKQRAITALTLKQPDVVPTFELEFQLGMEYFGTDFHSEEEWAGASSPQKESFIEDNARLYIRIAEYFDYCIIKDSRAWYPTTEDRIRSVKKIKELSGDKYMVILHGDVTYSIPDGDTMLEFTYELFDHGEEMKARAKKKVREALERAKRFVDAGIDGFSLCSDYCLNTGPFLSPAMFSEFITPYLAELIRGYREMGMYTIKHTDGNIMPIIDQLVSCEPQRADCRIYGGARQRGPRACPQSRDG
jgi:uroporphyrinogen decarboxylase